MPPLCDARPTRSVSEQAASRLGAPRLLQNQRGGLPGWVRPNRKGPCCPRGQHPLTAFQPEVTPCFSISALRENFSELVRCLRPDSARSGLDTSGPRGAGRET